MTPKRNRTHHQSKNQSIMGYDGIPFSHAVVLLDLIPTEKGEEPDEDDLDNFILTKEALQHQFAKTVLMMHPENNQEHGSQDPSYARHAFLLILEANKYLHTCLSYGHNTYLKARRMEQDYPTWKNVQKGMDEGLYTKMATLMIHLEQTEKLDITELLYFLKIHICGRPQTPPSIAATTYTTLDLLADYVRHSTQKAKQVGKKWWTSQSTKELQVYLVARDSTSVYFTDLYHKRSARVDNVKLSLISLCMTPYAPLWGHSCRVTGLTTPTWNDRTVTVIDCKVGTFYLSIYIHIRSAYTYDVIYVVRCLSYNM